MIINIRASSLDGYADCSRRAAASLFRDAIEDAGYKLRRLTPGVGAAIGTSVHKAAAHMLTGKMETGGEPDREDATEVAVETFKGEIEHGVMWDDTSPRSDDAHQQIRSLTREVARSVVPAIEPVAVEELMQARFPISDELTERGVEVIVSGHADALQADVGDDLKTGAVRPSSFIQYGLYALLARTTKGLPIQKFREHWVPRVSKRTPQPKPEVTEIDVPRAEQAATAMVDRIVGDATAFLATEDPECFMPNPQSMLCSEILSCPFDQLLPRPQGSEVMEDDPNASSAYQWSIKAAA